MIKLKLTNVNKYVLVDKNFAPFFELHSWYLHKSSGYAVTSFRGKKLSIHQLLLKYSSNQECDHIDRNKLNNTLKNLRVVSKKENRQNISINCRNTSGYKGVSFNKKNKNWVAYIGKTPKIYLGSYLTKERAAFAYNVASMLSRKIEVPLNNISKALVKTYIHENDISRKVKNILGINKRIRWNIT